MTKLLILTLQFIGNTALSVVDWWNIPTKEPWELAIEETDFFDAAIETEEAPPETCEELITRLSAEMTTHAIDITEAIEATTLQDADHEFFDFINAEGADMEQAQLRFEEFQREKYKEVADHFKAAVQESREQTTPLDMQSFLNWVHMIDNLTMAFAHSTSYRTGTLNREHSAKKAQDDETEAAESKVPEEWNSIISIWAPSVTDA